MIRCVEQAGMELLAMYDAFPHTPQPMTVNVSM